MRLLFRFELDALGKFHQSRYMYRMECLKRAGTIEFLKRPIHLVPEGTSILGF